MCVGYGGVIGNSDITGSVVATAFTGDGSGLTNLANDSRWEGVHAGVGTGIYPTDLLNVGIGTTSPGSKLTVEGDIRQTRNASKIGYKTPRC